MTFADNEGVALNHNAKPFRKYLSVFCEIDILSTFRNYSVQLSSTLRDNDTV